jgi:hypothetical protein
MTHEPDFPPLSPRRRRPLAVRAAIFARHSTYHSGGCQQLPDATPIPHPRDRHSQRCSLPRQEGKASPLVRTAQVWPRALRRVPRLATCALRGDNALSCTLQELGCAHEDALSLARRWQSSPHASALPRPRVPYQLQARWPSASLGSRGCLGYDVLQERKRRRLHPDVTTEPELDWKGMPLDRSLW